MDQEAVVDGSLVTSRNPKDIPAFNREVAKRLSNTKLRGVVGTELPSDRTASTASAVRPFGAPLLGLADSPEYAIVTSRISDS